MPERKLSRKEKKFNERPWITKGLRISIAKKNELYKQSKVDPLKIAAYKRFSNLLIKLKTKAHDDFDKQRISDHGHNKRNDWQIINERINRKKSNAPQSNAYVAKMISFFEILRILLIV